MPTFQISPSLHPIRLTAYMRTGVELTIEIENLTDSPAWTECDVILPDAVSLAPDRDLQKGRLRIGIINPKEVLTGKCKIYSSARTYPDSYPVKLIAYAFGRDGAIIGREERRTEVRAERLGQ